MHVLCYYRCYFVNSDKYRLYILEKRVGREIAICRANSMGVGSWSISSTRVPLRSRVYAGQSTLPFYGS